VAGAIQRLRQGGVRIVMITGDYGLTAESMARRVGMLATPAPRILTGAELDGLNDLELQQIVRGQEVIFARMAPDHKLRLVSCFQAQGDVVAVIGDGVNDTPALRKADIGIAMGVAGTDVAKEAADLVLTNDDFSAIAAAVEEGRAVYDNLRKSITYIFASNVPEIVPFILTATMNIPLALAVRQILAIDLGTDLLPALALGTENPEPGVMSRPPRRKEQPLLDSGLLARAFLWLGPIEAALCYAGFISVYLAFGHPELFNLPRLPWLEALNPLRLPLRQVHLVAVTVFLAGVVTAQIGNAFACRTEKAKGRQLGWISNPFLLLGVAAETAIVLALIYFPPLRTLFGLHPLPPLYWIGLAMYAPVLYALDRIRKSIVWRVEQIQNHAHEGGMKP